MAEYSSDEERFSAFVNFFKDHKNTLLIGSLLLTVMLISSMGYKSYNSSQNLKAAEIYNSWFANLSSEPASALSDNENFDKRSQDHINKIKVLAENRVLGKRPDLNLHA